jgi:RNA polymerase sigma factor (TIGR02999 family)
LLGALGQGQRDALAELLPLVYDELRELASSAMRNARPGHTLQPTAVVHEAFVRLVGGDVNAYESRDHFFAVAARAMRSVLVDHARRRGSQKRRGPGERVELTDSVAGYEERGLDLLAVEEALLRLALVDPDLVRVVELLYFAGLSSEETARVIGCSSRTVERDWRTAKAFLRATLESGEAPI